MVNIRHPSFWIVISLAFFYAIVEVAAFYNLKHKNVVIAVICYLLIICILLKAYEYKDIGHMNLITSIISISLSYTISYLYLGEKINKYTFIAVVFAILAIYFAHLSDE